MRNNDPFSDLIRSLEENLQKDGGWEPPAQGPRQPPEGNPRRLLWFLIPLLVFIFFNRVISFYADWMWYDSLGFDSVYFTRLYANLGLFLAGALIFWLIVAVNVWLARRIEPAGLANTALEQLAHAFGLRVSTVVLGVAAVFAVFMGLSASGNWESLLIYLNQVPFNVNDPLFQRDVGFFVFVLPIWQIARNWLMTTLVMTLIATAVVYGIGWRGWNARTPVLMHLAILGALLLGLVAWQYRLDALQLVYSNRGVTFGAGYTDSVIQLPVYNILAVVTLVVAVLLLITAWLRQAWRAIVVVLAAWVVLAVVAGNIFPSLVQRFQVTPNELTLERPYIGYNIQLTRLAYDLADVVVQPYDASNRLTADDLIAEAETILNVRLWDYRPLLETYNQIQALRQYYAFNDIDIDRYVIDGQLRQVMLSVRELVPERLNPDAQTWVNRRLVYTHGYGVAASPVAQVTRDGLPDFYLKDLPPTGPIPITQPQVYFGELTNDYVIARTNEPEFDYPSGEGNVMSHFSADTGIDMGFGAKLLFAIRFADINMLLNQDITSDSQLLWRRNIVQRAQEVAPFLRFDQDPYIVISEDGGLYWIHDAYTVSNRFPYSEPFGAINYIRNSVKIVTSAYDGSMTFYIVDETEPIIAAYARIFPALFRPIAEMPADLLAHIRYPQDLFTVQAETYRVYHMTDVNEFYNREDVWAWPEEIFQDQRQRMEPYYVLMALPGEREMGFIQILPFTPANRENMIAWMAAQSDPAVYGNKVVYEFGKDSLFFGPQQVEARINQDPVISAQLALWNQQGSTVIRGNLLVIPIAGALLYVEPLYLQAATGRIPELQRVIVATANRVVMAENFGLALATLFGGELLADTALAELATFGGEVALDEQVLQAIETGATMTELEGELTVQQLAGLANEHFARAQEYAQQGNWAGYGVEIGELQRVIGELVAVTGAQVTPAPLEEVGVELEPAGGVEGGGAEGSGEGDQ
jgi:uncharacterized protein